jgi:hypothetical protein
MTLRKRIDRLAKSSPPGDWPVLITLLGICPDTREAVSAVRIGGLILNRDEGETEADFLARVGAENGGDDR